MKRNIGIQSLIFPNPVLVVGTYDIKGNPNVMTLAYGGIVASDPASIAISVRPSRYSYEAIVRTQAFSVNIPSVQYAAEADFFGIVSGSDVNKLATTGLTPMRGEYVDAPYILEFPYSMECVVTGSLELGSHTLFVGEIKGVKVDDALLDIQGNLAWGDAQLLSVDSVSKEYRAPGQHIAQAQQVGKKFISR